MIRLNTQKTKGGIAYRVSYGFRIFCGFVLAFLLWGIILYLSEGERLSSMVLPLILAILCLVGLSYRETWIFDNGKGQVTSLFGFGPFVKRTIYPYEDILHLELRHFVRGTMDEKAVPSRKQRKRAMIVFSLVLAKDEERKTIEVIAERVSEGRSERAAQAISAVSGLGLVVDRPRDMDLKTDLKDI